MACAIGTLPVRATMVMLHISCGRSCVQRTRRSLFHSYPHPSLSSCLAQPPLINRLSLRHPTSTHHLIRPRFPFSFSFVLRFNNIYRIASEVAATSPLQPVLCSRRVYGFLVTLSQVRTHSATLFGFSPESQRHDSDSMK